VLSVSVEISGEGGSPAASSPIQRTLHEVIELLAGLDRTPCSAGERQAAQWLGRRIGSLEGVEVDLEDEDSWGTFAPTATGLGLLGVLASILVLAGRRRTGGLLAALTVAGIVDEAQNGPRLLRRLVRRRRGTVNVLARMGDLERRETLVLLVHHDAPQTGLLFDQSLQKWVYRHAPALLERVKTPLPQWWLGLAGPLASLYSALRKRPAGARAGVVLGAIGSALVADVWRSPTVPGANDNLSGVAAMVAFAELLAEKPIGGLRVLAVSCGAEETLQDGVRAFLKRHREELDPRLTWFVNLDTVGSKHLIQLEGEGPIWMEDYAGPWLRDLLAERAQALGISLERGFRARSSSDSVIPSRAGYPIATLLSIADWRAPANYHLQSDVPQNIVYETVEDSVRLVHALATALAERSSTRTV
jgi:Peptidase family M28